MLQGASGDVCRAAGDHEEAEDRPGGGLRGLHGGQLQAALCSQWSHCQGQELLSSVLFSTTYYTFYKLILFSNISYIMYCKVYIFLYPFTNF